MISIVTGVLLVIAGISIFLQPISYSQKYAMVLDFTKVKTPLSLAAVALGAFCIFIGWRSKTNDEYSVDYWICPNCEEVYEMIGKGKHYCRICKTPIEKLKGFYER